MHNSNQECVLEYVACKGITGKANSDNIYAVLTQPHIDLDPKNVVAQTYDGAANMAGSANGTEAVIITEHAPNGVYFHCCSHNLNIVIVQKVEVIPWMIDISCHP